MNDDFFAIMIVVMLVLVGFLLFAFGVASATDNNKKKLCYPEAMCASNDNDIQCSNSKIAWDEKTGWKRVTQ
jgi:hypothetical protein